MADNFIFNSFPQNWHTFLKESNIDALLKKSCDNVEDEYLTKVIFPSKENIFKALELTSPEDVKVVIIGQDPYHGVGQACGLSFSVSNGIKLPPSLVNIFKELSDDIGIEIPTYGDLSSWAKQGVLLLNSTLTVESGKAASHKKMGWEPVTQKIIDTLSTKRDNIVYILWGSFAQKVGNNIDENKNLVIKSVHPSPLSSYRGFFKSKPFSKSNNYLINNNIDPIKW